MVVACAAETARQGRAVAVVDRPSCLAREDGQRSPGRVRRRRLLPRVEVEQQRTGRQGGKVGTLCTRAAFALHLLQKRALAAGAGGGAAVLARGCAGARRRRGSRELSSLAAGGARDRASGRGDRGPWWLPAWRLHEMLLGRGLADSISSTQGPVLVSACPIAHDFSDPAPNSEDHAELDLEALHLMGGQHQERQQQYGLAASKMVEGGNPNFVSEVPVEERTERGKTTKGIWLKRKTVSCKTLHPVSQLSSAVDSRAIIRRHFGE